MVSTNQSRRRFSQRRTNDEIPSCVSRVDDSFKETKKQEDEDVRGKIKNIYQHISKLEDFLDYL